MTQLGNWGSLWRGWVGFVSAAIAAASAVSGVALPTSAALSALFAVTAKAEPARVKLSHLRGNVYVVVDDYPLSDENSAVYVGKHYVTVVGATFSPATAKALADEVARITRKPIREVIDTNYNLDRAGGNPYFRSIGAKIYSITLTRDLLTQKWAEQVANARVRYSDYPDIPLVLPDITYPANFELQDGRVLAVYVGPSHSPL